jgi:short-subunit dehydrogenase
MPKTWFVTGATRGLGVEIAKDAIMMTLPRRQP